MTRPRPRIGSELLPVVLILASLAGTGFLVASMHRRASAQRKAARTAVQTSPVPFPVRIEPAPAPPAPEPKPDLPPPPAPPLEDPTRNVLARLGAEEAEQLLAAQEADRKAAALETARQAAVAESEKWRRREAMARAQLDELDSRARKLEEDADMLAMDRDVLANERDAAKAALARAANRAGSYAILPNKSPNGTWRRPIILECKNGTATLQPKGPTLSLLDLSPLLSPRSSPLINVVLREMLRTRGMTTPDGAAAVPYIFFVVRPDGILPYYQARARLETLGIAFGYELVDQDMEIEYPDLDNVDEWDGSGPPISSTPPLVDTKEPAQPTNRTARTRDGRGDPADAFVWPTHPQPSTGGADLSGLDRPPTTSGSGRGGSATDDGNGRGGSASGRGMGGGSPGLGDGMGRFGPSLGEGQGPGPRPGRGGSGFGPDPGVGGNGTTPFNDPGPFGAPLAGTPGPSSVNPPRGPRPRAGTGASGEPRGLVPLNPDRLPGLEEATALANLDHQASSGGSEAEGHPSASGAQAGEPGMPGSTEAGGSTESSGSGSGTGGSGRTRVGAGQRGGGGGSQGPPSGVPVGLGSISQGDESRQGSSSGQPAQGSGFGSSSGGSSERGPKPGGTDPLGRPLKIDAPMEIVVACGPDGVVLHPGGYRISKEILKTKNSLLAKQLSTIVQLWQQVDPMIRPIPSIRFLVEPMGNDTYREARKQTVLSGMDWPVTLQLGDANILDFVPEERF